MRNAGDIIESLKLPADRKKILRFIIQPPAVKLTRPLSSSQCKKLRYVPKQSVLFVQAALLLAIGKHLLERGA